MESVNGCGESASCLPSAACLPSLTFVCSPSRAIGCSFKQLVVKIDGCIE